MPPEKPLHRADLTGADSMTDLHFANFIAAIRTGENCNQPVASGNVSVTMLQLSNIAWEVERELKLDPSTGHILDDKEAMKSWNREYEKGWAPHISTNLMGKVDGVGAAPRSVKTPFAPTHTN